MDEEYNNLMSIILRSKSLLDIACYKTNNRFAYIQDLTGIPPESEAKHYNFVPSYDKWCLYCDAKNCKVRCSICKFVYYCNDNCQKKSWEIHKNHCKRDLFCVCIMCGKDEPKIKCDSCPVKFCDDNCKNQIYSEHKAYDCDTFSKFVSTL